MYIYYILLHGNLYVIRSSLAACVFSEIYIPSLNNSLTFPSINKEQRTKITTIFPAKSSIHSYPDKKKNVSEYWRKSSSGGLICLPFCSSFPCLTVLNILLTPSLAPTLTRRSRLLKRLICSCSFVFLLFL